MNSRISSKGQVTVPVAARESLGLRTGTPVEFIVCDGGIMLRKSTDTTHPVDAAYGCLTLDGPVDTLIEEMRGPAPWRPATTRRPPKQRKRKPA